MTDLCWQLSVVRASSQVVVLRCSGLWGEECMQCVSRIVQCIAEQPVVGLIQQFLKVRQIRRAVAATFAASHERLCQVHQIANRLVNCINIYLHEIQRK